MLVELAETMRGMEVESTAKTGSDARIEAYKEVLRRVGQKILQENNGHVDVQFNLQGDSAGALVLLLSVDALYVPYNLG
jgi:hypothetical protein